MSFASIGAELVEDLVGIFGQEDDGTQFQVWKRLFHTLRDPAGAPLTALDLDGAVAGGGDTLNLDTANGRLAGKMPAGISLTIAGVTGTYTTTGETKASSNALTGVVVTPVLEGPASDDALVTFGEYTDVGPYNAVRGGFRLEDLSDSVEAKDSRIWIHPSGQTVDWFEKDHCVLESGEILNVVTVRPYRPNGVDTIGWILQTRQ